MLRRLFNDLKQRIECRDGQHMHLIDDIHTLSDLGRGINCIIPEVPDIVDTVVGSCVDFQYVHAGTFVDAPAGFTPVTGITVFRMEAVHRLGQDLGAGGLARTPGTGEQVCMAHLAGQQLMLQRLGNRQLTHHIIKGLRTVFTI